MKGEDILSAFNGQIGRVAIFEELILTIPFQAVVETGTFLGGTTELFLKRLSVPVYTVELDRNRAKAVADRFSNNPAAHVIWGDSRQLLADLGKNETFPDQKVFFYLDAHWFEDLPLRDEIEQIVSHWRRSVIMIDDFQVPLDHGYGYDSYGAEKSLCLEYVRPQIAGLPVFFPVMPSDIETGAGRGCVIIGTDHDIEPSLDRLITLRRWRQQSD